MQPSRQPIRKPPENLTATILIEEEIVLALTDAFVDCKDCRLLGAERTQYGNGRNGADDPKPAAKVLELERLTTPKSRLLLSELYYDDASRCPHPSESCCPMVHDRTKSFI